MKRDPGRAVAEVTQNFLGQHSGFLHYGQYAVRLPFAIERVSCLWSGSHSECVCVCVCVFAGEAVADKRRDS